MGIPEKKLRILHIEDSEVDCAKVREYLLRVGHKIDFERVCSRDDFFQKIHRSRWDLIISDYFISGLSVVEALEKSRELDPNLPFILVSGRIGEESVADLMNAGIEDVVMKSHLERLVPVVRRILREHEIKDREELSKSVANLAYAAKEQMLAIVSHDIKNPLSAIQLDAQMLLRTVEQRPNSLSVEEVKIQARRILRTTDRLKTLISDLLDKNKKEDGLASICRIPTEPSKIIQEVVDACRPLLTAKEIVLKLPELTFSTPIPMDRNKMFQVLSNLLSNALKFTPSGGEIRIELEDKKTYYLYSVSDSGPGLKMESIQKIFEKYWTGGSGNGLGLFICKTIVEAHGGHIHAGNNDRNGAHFSFSLPKPLSQIEGTPYRVSVGDSHIVVIDDDEDLREVISWALSKEGYLVRSFSDAAEALTLLREGHLHPGLIIVDYHMDGMKGNEFLKLKMEMENSEIRKCPVIMISASPDEVESEVDRNLYLEILTKPIDLEGLVEKIKMSTTALVS